MKQKILIIEDDKKLNNGIKLTARWIVNIRLTPGKGIIPDYALASNTGSTSSSSAIGVTFSIWNILSSSSQSSSLFLSYK